MRRSSLIAGLAAVVLFAVGWVMREDVVECWGFRTESACTIRNRWTGTLTTRWVEPAERDRTPYVAPPDSARVLDRLMTPDTGSGGVNPFARFRKR